MTVQEYISETMSKLKFLDILPAAMSHSSSGGVAINYVFPVGIIDHYDECSG